MTFDPLGTREVLRPWEEDEEGGGQRSEVVHIVVSASCKQSIGFEHPQIKPSHQSLSSATPAVGPAPPLTWLPEKFFFPSQPECCGWASVSQSNLCMQDICFLTTNPVRAISISNYNNTRRRQRPHFLFPVVLWCDPLDRRFVVCESENRKSQSDREELNH